VGPAAAHVPEQDEQVPLLHDIGAVQLPSSVHEFPFTAAQRAAVRAAFDTK
jgi:hypothetical protein